jgi:hypothetical protein
VGSGVHRLVLKLWVFLVVVEQWVASSDIHSDDTTCDCGGRRASVLQRIRGTYNWNSRSQKEEEKKKRNSAIVSSGFVHKLRNKEAGEETKGADYQHVGVSS